MENPNSFDHTISQVFEETCGRVYKIKLPIGIQPGQLVEAELRNSCKIIYKLKEQDIQNQYVILSEN